MRLTRWRAAAWAALLCGLLVSQIGAASEPTHTTKTTSASSSPKSTSTTTASHTGGHTVNTASTANAANSFPLSGASILNVPTTTAQKTTVESPKTGSNTTGNATTPTATTPGTTTGNTSTANTTAANTAGVNKTTTGTTTSNTGNRNSTNGNSTNSNSTNSNTNNGTAINQNINPLEALREAHQLVGTVPYTYDGHKTQAIRDIHEAIHKLTPPKAPNPNAMPNTHNTIAPTTSHNSGHSGNTGTTSNTGNNHVMSQAAADARLQHAMNLLNVVHGKVQGENEAAAVDIAGAMAELKLALQKD